MIGLSARIHHPAAFTGAPNSDDAGRPTGIWTRTLHYLEQSAAHWVMSGGALAVMVPPLADADDPHAPHLPLDAYAQALDGLVLQGGNDVAPEHYDESPLHDDWRGDAVRDRYEMALVDAFLAAGKPVFGICRGLQLLNVHFGGTLYQDIATQQPGAGAHRDIARYEQHHHTIELVPGSRLAAMYPDVARAQANSIHHQAIKDLASGFVVEARCPDDGLVEAIRHVGDRGWVAAVQWHPEFHQPVPPGGFDDRPLLQDFLAAARAARSA